jgi:hypothetical protein
MGDLLCWILSTVGLVAIAYMVLDRILAIKDYIKNVDKELKRLDDMLNQHYSYIGSTNENLMRLSNRLSMSKLEKGKK